PEVTIYKTEDKAGPEEEEEEEEEENGDSDTLSLNEDGSVGSDKSGPDEVGLQFEEPPVNTELEKSSGPGSGYRLALFVPFMLILLAW
ncbi:hypothetical protein ACHAXS_000611, partial [Conticribra weissflogii]